MSVRILKSKIEQARAARNLPPPPAPPVEDGECWAEDDYGLQGGQGREPRDLDAAAGIMAAVGLALLVLFAGGVAFWALAKLGGMR